MLNLQAGTGPGGRRRIILRRAAKASKPAPAGVDHESLHAAKLPTDALDQQAAYPNTGELCAAGRHMAHPGPHQRSSLTAGGEAAGASSHRPLLTCSVNWWLHSDRRLVPTGLNTQLPPPPACSRPTATSQRSAGLPVELWGFRWAKRAAAASGTLPRILPGAAVQRLAHVSGLRPSFTCHFC